MNNKLIVLVAESCAGKDTVLKILVDKYKMRRVVSHTTRPIRENEIDGIDYHFISQQKFMEMESQGKFVETREYNTIQDGEPTVWYYGVTQEEVCLDGGNAVIVLDIQGLQHMEEYLGRKNMLSFYLRVDQEERLRRAKAREDNMDEVLRRLADDKIKFADAERVVDLTIYNRNGLLSVEDIAWIINERVKNERL